MTGITAALFYLLVFPGFVSLLHYALFCEWVDRFIYARLQNRVGPPLFQPFTDIIKLLSKEDITPSNIDRLLFQYTPLIAFAAVMTPIVAIPVLGTEAPFAIPGDLIVTLYLLSIPTLALFVIGWASTSMYPLVGAVRRPRPCSLATIVPFILVCLTAGVLAGSWCISDITAFLALRPPATFILLPAFLIALIALEAKLERSPVDIPHAETEIVGGTLTEYSGKKLAVMRLVTDLGMVTGASLLAPPCLGGITIQNSNYISTGMGITPVFNFALYLAKTLGIVFLLALIRTLFTRLRIDQMLEFSWKYLAAVGILQLFLVVLYTGIYQV